MSSTVVTVVTRYPEQEGSPANESTKKRRVNIWIKDIFEQCAVCTFHLSLNLSMMHMLCYTYRSCDGSIPLLCMSPDSPEPLWLLCSSCIEHQRFAPPIWETLQTCILMNCWVGREEVGVYLHRWTSHVELRGEFLFHGCSRRDVVILEMGDSSAGGELLVSHLDSRCFHNFRFKFNSQLSFALSFEPVQKETVAGHS